MAFDQTTRNRLASFVTASRKLIAEEFTRQLRNVYGMDPESGDVSDIAVLPTMGESDRQTARILRDTLQHYLASSPKQDKKARAAVIDRIIREQAFTVLNRLAAVRMAEARNIFIESVAKGTQSKGFKLYQSLAGTGLGETGDAYIVYLFSVFDEFAIDLPVLFDRYSENGRLFPSTVVLDKLLEEINHFDLEHLWGEDETIGWIYQYFNSNEERRAMRDASQAPRNSRELAVRNQFFTPRYVVEFLTDNTLGRIWYEMRMGQTGLVDRCQYLVQRPDEVFLSASTSKPEDKASYFDDGVIEATRLLSEGVDPSIHEDQDYDDKSDEELEALHANDFPAFSAENDDEISRMVALAHCVDSYSSGTGFDTRGAEVESGRFDDLSTQQILEHLFITARGDRHGGDGECYRQDWFAGACNEVRRRALRSHEDDLSQEELLRQPVFLAYRQLKDPREIRMIDPACGSMHFGLYAFDLYLQIYEEYWDAIVEPENEEYVRTETDLPRLRSLYTDKGQFLRDVPRLIIEHNIHGVDIDRRAVQIAGLSLWLRAQRAWNDAGIKPPDRPVIERSNIVCAEPMPGDNAQLEEFIERTLSSTSEQQVIASVIRKTFESMKLAGDAGSLLQIENEIATTIAEAKEEWIAAPTERQLPLLTTDESEPPVHDRPLLTAGITDKSFWDEIEPRIYRSLEDYATNASDEAYRNKLFAKDTANGFAFIDVCRKRYDVALMNPPFGDAAISTRKYLTRAYPHAKDDVFTTFVVRMREIAITGTVGVLSNRTGFFLSGTQRWRRAALLDSPGLRLLADLGDGVLDDALVEAAAYTLGQSTASSMAIRLLDKKDKEKSLLETCEELRSQFCGSETFVFRNSDFAEFPDQRISYWASPSVRNIYRSYPSASENSLDVKFGLSTKDDFRFLRLCWEVGNGCIENSQERTNRDRRWMFLAKGGEYSPHFCDIHLLANWAGRGHEIGARIIERYPYLNGDTNWILHSEVPYGAPGVTYTKRTTSGFSPRFLPSGCLISDKGCTIFSEDSGKLPAVLAIYGSKAFAYLLEFNLSSGDTVSSGSPARDYEIGMVASIPIPPINEVSSDVADNIRRIWNLKVLREQNDETGRYFSSPFGFACLPSLKQNLLARQRTMLDGYVETLSLNSIVEQNVQSAYHFDDEAMQGCRSEFGPDVNSYRTLDDIPDEVSAEVARLWGMSTTNLIRTVVESKGHARYFSKLVYVAHRELELICHYLELSPKTICKVLTTLDPSLPELKAEADRTVSFALGVVFGRWLSNVGCQDQLLTFDPIHDLPSIAPASVREAKGSINEAKILTSDSSHPKAISKTVREQLVKFFGESGDIDAEISSYLNVQSLDCYFDNCDGFFAEHFKRYSKSRRNAPIYWPIQSLHGKYTLWLYFHALNEQTLFVAANEFIDPKLREIDDEVKALLTDQSRSSEDNQRLGELSETQTDLSEFRDDVLRIAKFWKPNLNDGVQITAAPLWKFFKLPRWRNKLKDTWEKLEEGEYDWAHLSLSIWPARVVREKCTTDRSIAIAHDMEDLFWVEDGKWRRLMEPDAEASEQIKRRQSDKRTRLLGLIEQFVLDHADQSADVLSTELPEGDHDDTQVALALWPTRVGEKCWTDLKLSETLGIKQNSRSRSKAAKAKLIKRLETAGLGELGDVFTATFAGVTGTVQQAWQQLAEGHRDDAPLAIELWPERVVPKCVGDADLAITHGIERFLWTRHPAAPDDTRATYRKRQAIDTEIKNEIARVEAL